MSNRRHNAWQLFKDAANGPWIEGMDKEQYNLWVSTWILPKLVELIPELKNTEYQYATTANQVNELPGYTAYTYATTANLKG